MTASEYLLLIEACEYSREYIGTEEAVFRSIGRRRNEAALPITGPEPKRRSHCRRDPEKPSGKSPVKRITALAALIALSLSMLTACGRHGGDMKGAPVIRSSPVQAAASEPAAGGGTSAEALGLDSIVLREDGTIPGGVIPEDASAWVTDGESGTEGAFSYCLPSLTDSRFDTAAFRQWTDSCFAEWKNAARYTSDGIDKSLGYRAFVIGDVLSVMLTYEDSYRAGIWYTNPSICFSLSTGKRLELNDMMELAGIPMEQLPNMLTQMVQSIADSEERMYGSVEGIDEYHAAILTEENLAKTEFVLWPGNLSNTRILSSDADDSACYPAGRITLRVWIPYQITEINGIPTPEMRDGYMMNSVWIPGLEIG